MIHRLLVANRGEIARRVIATCRRLGIETVAVYADPDSHSPHVREADLAVRLNGSAATDTYLRADLLVAAARLSEADAVHPGYGFLAESAEFASAVLDAGLTWVGPSPATIAAMGSKVEAKARVRGAGVPMLPSWTDPAQVSEFPVLVKASAGGGGRGMRLVERAADLPAALAAARHEASRAFGDSRVFCERFVRGGRHIEVQVIGDHHGHLIAIGERECSIQRRHQKIIEESPSPAVTEPLRQRLYAAAVAAAAAVDYVGAGTVEFLLDPSGEFSFLEMNTRLQVEHPVTECVTGLDLVELQLRVARGETLPLTGPPPVRGHAIEARLYAEDPARDWQPCTGTLHHFHLGAASGQFRPLLEYGVRLDSGVESGSEISPFYDPMLAKVISWGANRADAAAMLATALRGAQLDGVRTNRDLLVQVLRSPAFADGDTDTSFLDRHPHVFAPLLDGLEFDLACLAAALSASAHRHASAPWAALPAGWRNVGGGTRSALFHVDSPVRAGRAPEQADEPAVIDVRYRTGRAGELLDWSVDPAAAAPPEVTSWLASADQVVLLIGDRRQTYQIRHAHDKTYVDTATGSLALTRLPRFPSPLTRREPGSLITPMPGTVGRVLVAAGQLVHAGDVLLTVEAMKLEHPILAPHDGTVMAIDVKPGDHVAAGGVLAVVSANPLDAPPGISTPHST